MGQKSTRWEHEPTKIGGRTYYHIDYYITKYDISEDLLRVHRRNGLPSEKIGRGVFINEDDFHAYFSGKIGGEEKPDGRCGPRDPDAPPHRTPETRPEVVSAMKCCQSIMNAKRYRALHFPEISAYRENYTQFRTEAGYRKKELRAGVISAEEFRVWLDEWRERVI